MPLMRYFLFVGGALLALLFVCDAYAPKQPVASSADTMANAQNTSLQNPSLRIRSDRKWPERIVFDTSIPTIVPAPVTTAAVPAPTIVADLTAQARVRDSFAQFAPPESIKPESKVQRKRKIVRNRAAQPTLLAAQQPRFGFFANN